MQTDRIIVLFFPGVERDLLNQFWQRKLADLCRPWIAFNRFCGKLSCQFRRFLMLQRL